VLGRTLELSPLGKLKRDLHLGLRRRLALLMYRILRSRATAKAFAKVRMFSSSEQQVQLPCAGCNLFVDHKSCSSTTTWGRGRSTSRNWLNVSVCTRNRHYSHQQLSQYNALLSRAYRIETKAVLRDQERCKPFLCWSSLFVYCLLLRTCVLFAENLALIVLISSETNRKIGHNLCRMQYLIVASM
jgi:hypothetical protein